MKKTLLIFISLIIFILSSGLSALEKGKWIFIKDNDWCYIGALNIETDLPKDKNRGENYIIVYKIIGSDENSRSYR